MLQRKIIFSAIQPTGKLHLGNYLGVIRPWIHIASSLSKDDDIMYIGLADLHALTTQFTNLSNTHTTTTAIHLIASGIDPSILPITLFRQSRVNFFH